MVIPPKYEEAFYFNEGLAAVQILDKWGYIDKRNQWVIPARYKSAYNFEDGMARVSQNDKYGYIDKKGKVVIPFKYETFAKKPFLRQPEPKNRFSAVSAPNTS